MHKLKTMPNIQYFDLNLQTLVIFNNSGVNRKTGTCATIVDYSLKAAVQLLFSTALLMTPLGIN